jgi:hypothetical protein
MWGGWGRIVRPVPPLVPPSPIQYRRTASAGVHSLLRVPAGHRSAAGFRPTLPVADLAGSVIGSPVGFPARAPSKAAMSWTRPSGRTRQLLFAAVEAVSAIPDGCGRPRGHRAPRGNSRTQRRGSDSRSSRGASCPAPRPPVIYPIAHQSTQIPAEPQLPQPTFLPTSLSSRNLPKPTSRR